MAKNEMNEQILKSLNGLLDETLREFEALKKSDRGGELQAASESAETKIAPNTQGDMPAIAGESKVTGAGVDGNAKEGQPATPANVTATGDAPKESLIAGDAKDKANKAPMNKESEKKKDEDEEDEEKKKEKEEKDNPFVKKMEEVATANETLKKSVDERFDALLKANSELTKTITSLVDRVEKLASSPVGSRKAVSGLAPLKKTEDGDGRPLSKGEVVNKLLELQKSGDKRVNGQLITKCELASYDELPNLVKGIL